MKRTTLPAWFGLSTSAVITLGLLVASQHHVSKRATARVEVQIAQQEDNFFLDLQGVKALIGADESVVTLRRQDVKLAKMERKLRSTGYVDRVSASFVREGQLKLEVHLRKPIARVLDETSGASWYIDERGHRIRRSPQFTARVPIVRGRFEEAPTFSATLAATGADTLRDSTLRSIMPLVRALSADEFLQAFTAELVVQDRGQLILYPQLGSATVAFGTIQNYRQKLHTLKTFCREVLPHAGWDRYRQITLQYNGQLVARRSS